MQVSVSKFIEDPLLDLTPFAGASMQVAFFRRATFHSVDHAAFRKRLDDHGIRVKSVHAPAADVYHDANGEFIGILRTIRDAYGVEVITVHPQRGTKEGAKSKFRELEREIARLGVTLAYETFERETMNVKWVSQVEEMHRTFDAFKYPFLAVTYDFTHSEYGENVEEVSEYNNMIRVIHLSDALRNKPLDQNERHQHLPLGMGDYRVTEFLDLLRKIGYRHEIVIEYHPEYDGFLRGDAAAVEAYMEGDEAPLAGLIDSRRGMKAERDA